MEEYPTERDKPWRPGDYPRLGPSWDEAESIENAEQGVHDAED